MSRNFALLAWSEAASRFPLLHLHTLPINTLHRIWERPSNLSIIGLGQTNYHGNCVPLRQIFLYNSRTGHEVVSRLRDLFDVGVAFVDGRRGRWHQLGLDLALDQKSTQSAHE